LTGDAFMLLLGRRYNRAKKGAQNEHHSDVVESRKTAEKIGEQHGVSHASSATTELYARAVRDRTAGALRSIAL